MTAEQIGRLLRALAACAEQISGRKPGRGEEHLMCACRGLREAAPHEPCAGKGCDECLGDGWTETSVEDAIEREQKRERLDAGAVQIDHCFVCGAGRGQPCAGPHDGTAGKTPEQIAAEMVPEPEYGEASGKWWPRIERLGGEKPVHLLPETSRVVAGLAADRARSLVAWIVQRVREEPVSKASEAYRAMAERPLPCGHKVEDLIGGPGTVTKCGACLAERQAAKGDPLHLQEVAAHPTLMGLAGGGVPGGGKC